MSLTAQQKEQFDKEGYILVEDALTNEETEQLKEVIDRIIGGDYSRLWNIADVIGKDKAKHTASRFDCQVNARIGGGRCQPSGEFFRASC